MGTSEYFERLSAMIKARPLAMEVEDLLRLAPYGDPDDAAAIRRLKEEHGWPDRGTLKGTRRREIPFGRWADYVASYLEGGTRRLLELALDKEENRKNRSDGLEEGCFAIAVLERVRDVSSVDAVLEIAAEASKDLRKRLDLALGCAGALNALTFFKPRVPLSPERAAKARAFLHRLAAMKLAPSKIQAVLCALRASGDEESIRLIQGLKPLPAPWKGLEKLVIQEIRERLA